MPILRLVDGKAARLRACSLAGNDSLLIVFCNSAGDFLDSVDIFIMNYD